jgi:hypothetical protein
MVSISSTLNGSPWFVAGDSSMIRQSTETTGSSGHSSSAMNDFDQCLDDGGLDDHSFTGHFHSWFYKKLANTILKKLDRVFFNDAWFSHFSSSTVEFLSPGVSDSSSEKKVSLIKKEKKRSFFAPPPPFCVKIYENLPESEDWNKCCSDLVFCITVLKNRFCS